MMESEASQQHMPHFQSGKEGGKGGGGYTKPVTPC
jgi:hypothetical protein